MIYACVDSTLRCLHIHLTNRCTFSPKPQPFFVHDYGDMNKMKYLDQYTLLTLLLRAAVVYAKKKLNNIYQSITRIR